MAGNRLPDPPLGINGDLERDLPPYLKSLVSAIQGLFDRILQNYQPRYRPYTLQPVTVSQLMGAAPSVRPGIANGRAVAGAMVFVTNPTAGAGGVQPRPAYFDGTTWRFDDDNTVVG